MKPVARVLALSGLALLLSACQQDMSLCDPLYCSDEYETPAPRPEPPLAATEVLEDEQVTTFEYDGIINRNIQNLLCNSVHHARSGRLDQAEQKLLLAKDDKLPALHDKNRISEEQFVALDDWMAELHALLLDDMVAYGSIDSSFPFDCAGVSEESEAIAEVVESEVDPAVPPAAGETGETGDSDFVRMVCYSAFASRELRLVSAVNYLNTAIDIAREEHGLSRSSWTDTLYILDGIARLRLRRICDVYREDYQAL